MDEDEDDNMGLRGPNDERAGDGGVSPLGCFDFSTVAIKSEF